MKKIVTLIVLVIISSLLVMIHPLVIGEEIETLHELDEVKFGFPFPFISQYLTLTPGIRDLPIHVTLGNPMHGNYINDFSWMMFGSNIAVISMLLILIVSCWKRFIR